MVLHWLLSQYIMALATVTLAQGLIEKVQRIIIRNQNVHASRDLGSAHTLVTFTSERLGVWDAFHAERSFVSCIQLFHSIVA